MSPELSVVLLCYRAHDFVRTSVRTISALLEDEKIDYELILVANYDAPNDPTPTIVKEIAQSDPRVRCTTAEKKGMMGWDLRSGLAMARGNYIALIDGDGQMPFEDIVRVYRAIKEKNVDMAKTYRTTRGDDVWRIIVSYLFNILFKILFPGLRAHDINSKPKIFSRLSLDTLQLTSNDWFTDAEMMIQARRYAFSIVEIPTVFKKLEGRRSFVKTHTIFEFLRNLAMYRMREFTIRHE